MKTIFCSLLLILIFSVSAVDAADDWTQKFPEPHPSARDAHAMAYIGGDKALLFGGYDGTDGTWYDETWVYDFSDNTWTQKYPNPHPSARISIDMAYIGGNQVLLFGGNAGGVMNDETWVYNLSDNTWIQKYPDPHPSARHGYAMANIGEDKVLLFGGDIWSSLVYDTWVYDLSDNTWIQKYPDPHPSERYYHAMANIGEDKVLLFGGYKGGDIIYDDDTWVYDLGDNTWTQKYPNPHPSARGAHAMTNIGGDKVLLFGGSAYVSFFNDTWVYHLSDNTWTQDMNTTQPSARSYHALSETSMDGSSYLVLFGGWDGAWDDETWTFGGGDYFVTHYRAVIAGVADYPGAGNDLQYPDDDAMDIKNSLLLYSNWADSNIQLLLDSEANKSNIKTAIETMGSMADSDDVCLLFFSGHGTNGTDIAPIDESDGLDEYICSYGSSLNEYIRDDELSDWLGNLPTTNVVVIVDTCFSGGQIKVVGGFTPKVLPGTKGVVTKGDGFATDITRRISVKDMDDNEGCVVLTACDDDELSMELSILENGLFTYFVVKGLEKNVDKNGNGELSAEETGKYATSIVNLLNRIFPFLKQHPQLYDDYPAGAPQSDELAVCIGEPQPLVANHDKDIEDINKLAAPAVVPVPKSSKLLQNYSNPFNPDTWIPYQLSEDADVTIKIYNVNGQLVRTLDLGHKQAGFYLSKGQAAYWDGKNEAGEALSSGVYFYQLQAGDFTATGKMLMVK
ncbi:T9SS type A sorting domain-containing protein [Candidatus Poribacteria bacterium]|nr:T9SS type A sorting domain-containing protein [Candidatus Poribacteria bacterium]